MLTVPSGPMTNIDKYDAAAQEQGILQRVLQHVTYEGDCWIWNGALNNRGYAVTTHDKKNLYVHRLTYRIAKGPLALGYVLDHLCRTPRCVNPMHTEMVTTAENTRRGMRGSELDCPKGHPYSGVNLRLYTDRHGYKRRYCIQCTNDRNAARSLRRVALAETLPFVQ